MLTTPLMAAVLGCAATPEDTGPFELPPPEETGDSELPNDTFRVDTSYGDTGGAAEPAHVLTRRHEGTWTMTPDGGSWSEMVGELVVTELYDGDEAEPACTATFALSGAPPEDDHAGCTVTFAVAHTLSAGDPTACTDPEIPEDGGSWNECWNDADDVVEVEYRGTGIWLPWWSGTREKDEITFLWEESVGIVGEDEE